MPDTRMTSLKRDSVWFWPGWICFSIDCIFNTLKPFFCLYPPSSSSPSSLTWLFQSPNSEPTRHNAYITIAGPDIDRPDLFKPAPYLTADHQISPKCLFRIRTQHTKEIPTHHHLRPYTNDRQVYSTYSDRTCPFCYVTPLTPVTGHETHYLLSCPSISPVMEPMYTPLKENLKRSALPSWEGLEDKVKISLLLGSSLPPQLDKRKTMRDQWRLCTGNYCALLALKLSSTLSSPPATNPTE
jgi:hypothetical protein